MPSPSKVLLLAAEKIDTGDNEFSCVAIVSASCDLANDCEHLTYGRRRTCALRRLYQRVYGVDSMHAFMDDAAHRVFALLTLRSALNARARF